MSCSRTQHSYAGEVAAHVPITYEYILGTIFVLFIGLVPITQDTYVHNKNSNVQGRSLNVIKVIFHAIRNCS